MMRTVLALALAIVLVAASMRPASAYNLSCDGLMTLLESDDPFERGIASGFLYGDVDFLAGLLCFVQNPQCNCVQNVVQGQTQTFASAVVDELLNCSLVDGSQAAFGSVSRAVRSLCPY
jgi:hypothetical protein